MTPLRLGIIALALLLFCRQAVAAPPGAPGGNDPRVVVAPVERAPSIHTCEPPSAWSAAKHECVVRGPGLTPEQQQGIWTLVLLVLVMMQVAGTIAGATR